MFNRNQFAPTSTKAMKEVVEQENEQINSGQYSGFLTLDEGLNKIRIYPKHPTERNFSCLRKCYWITIDVDGEQKRATVNDAVVHGGFKTDVIDEYIKFVRRTLGVSSDKEDSAKLKILNDYKKGLSSSSTWVIYCEKIKKEKKEFGLLELKKTVRDALNDEAIIEDGDEAIQLDPFTHPDEGIPVLITYNSKPNKKKGEDYYKVQMSKQGALPISDEDLEKFAKLTPLSELALFRYTLADFEKSIDGLRNWDEENEINLFDTDEFQQIVESLREEVESGAPSEDEPEEEKKPVKKTTPVSKPNKKIVEEPIIEDEVEEPFEVDEEVEEQQEEEQGAEDEFTNMTRVELVKYNASNSLGCKLLKSDTDDDIRVKIREAVSPAEAEEVEQPTPPPTVKKTATPPAAGAKKPSLAEIKASIAAKAKK